MIGFIDFILSLPPEGESVLLVKQKAVLDADGHLQYHRDGEIKYTWPASRLKKTVPAGATYVNIGSFIDDRLKKNFGARLVNCEHVLCLVLDDVMTKSKVPPLPPSWIMETSLGNYQYGYVFSLDDQPTKGDFDAAIKAIAVAGFTDAGAVGAARNVRLPGSVNLKPGRNVFESRLVDFHPESLFTLPHICAALGVVPGPADSDTRRAATLLDDGGDDVLAWLDQNGHLLSKRNDTWYDVVCPNAHEHSDGNAAAGYAPAIRSFCCHHTDGKTFKSADFLAWVVEQGGPSEVHGLRDELLVAAMSAALSRLTPTAAFPNVAPAVIADVAAGVKKAEKGRVDREGWFSRYAYICEGDMYFDVETRREIARSTYNAMYRHTACRSIHGKNPKIEASVYFDEHREEEGAHMLVSVTYAAGEPTFALRGGELYGNRWRNARPATVVGDATPWLAHVKKLIPIEFEREHLLDVLAHKVQFPAHKINHAVLLGGLPGCGKDTLFAPFIWAIGGPELINCKPIKSEELMSQWGYSLEREVMFIQELRQNDAKDRRALENYLKPVIAAPPEYLSVNRKGLHPYDILNRVLLVAQSNERAAISLPTEDRRWFCLWTDAPRMTDAEGTSLWNWLKHQGGLSAAAHWLHNRDVSAFNPGATPPKTDAKALLVEQGMSGAEAFLVDQITRGVGEFACGVVGSPFFALCDRVQGMTTTKLYPQALLHALKEAGWIDKGRVHAADLGNKHVFCRPDKTGMSSSELRRAVVVV